MSTKTYAALMMSVAVMVATLQPAEAGFLRKALKTVAPIVAPIVVPAQVVPKLVPALSPAASPSAKVVTGALGPVGGLVDKLRSALPGSSVLPGAVAPGVVEWILIHKVKKKVGEVTDAAKNAANEAQKAIQEAMAAFKEFMDNVKKYGPMVFFGGMALLGLVVLTLLVSLIRNIRDLLRPAHARQ
jgi:hypothetical protein